jgi:hypothetical protein
MKVIVAGGRDVTDVAAVSDAIRESGFAPSEIVSGGASGVDSIGEMWARWNNVPIRRFEADWEEHGRAAGPIRNRAMANYADALVLVWDGQSRGSRSMKQEAQQRGLKIYERILAAPSDERETE